MQVSLTLTRKLPGNCYPNPILKITPNLICWGRIRIFCELITHLLFLGAVYFTPKGRIFSARGPYIFADRIFSAWTVYFTDYTFSSTEEPFYAEPAFDIRIEVIKKSLSQEDIAQSSVIHHIFNSTIHFGIFYLIYYRYNIFWSCFMK